MFTPVSAFTTADPPRSNIAVTIIFVKKQKARKTMCATVPQLALDEVYHYVSGKRASRKVFSKG